MDSQIDSNSKAFPCISNQDENSNYSNSVCLNNPCKKCSEKTENERIIIASDIHSNDECWCSSVNDSELISFDTKVIWEDIAHVIKCIYRETNREFNENHSQNDIHKAKQHVQILTLLDAESLFRKLETIILEYINEIRNQILKRFQICLKTSDDGKLFISYFLDEYNALIQAAQNVSTIVSYLEEYYMKPLQLTWLLYNKHLYEKLVYTDKKVQHSMSTMIDLLEPSQDANTDYSPAEYTQLLNRFLAFDEEMFEIACLNKNCQAQLASISSSSVSKKRNSVGIALTNEKKICKKKQTMPQLDNEILNSSTTNSSNIESSTIDSVTASTSQQNLVVSSVRECEDQKASASILSVDSNLIGNDVTAASSTCESVNQNNNDDHIKQPTFQQILNTAFPIAHLQHEIHELKLHENKANDNNTENQNALINETNKKDQQRILNGNPEKNVKSNESSSNNQKEILTTNLDTASVLSDISLFTNLVLPPKPPLSAVSKLVPDFRPITLPSLNTTSTTKSSPFLSTKIQSASFTAGTFGSITANACTHSLSSNRKTLNIKLSHKPGSTSKSNLTLTSNNPDQVIHQVESNHEHSILLSTSASSNAYDDMQTSSVNNTHCDFDNYDLYSESDSSTTNSCTTSMSLPMTTTYACSNNQHDLTTRERLQLKCTIKNPLYRSKPSTTTKLKSTQHDDNIDDLMKFIDGNEDIQQGSKSKKNKRKKNKRNKKNPVNEDVNEKGRNQRIVKDSLDDAIKNLSEPEENVRLKIKESEEKNNISLTNDSIVASVDGTASKTVDVIQMNNKLQAESSAAQEDEKEMNWITISRKHSRHKTTPPVPIPSSSSASRTISSSIEQQRNRKSTKTKIPNTLNVNQPTTTREIVKTNNKQKQVVTLTSTGIESLVKKHDSNPQQQKPQSCWNTRQQFQEVPSSTLVATAPIFVPSSQTVPTKITDTPLLEEFLSTPYGNLTAYSDPVEFSQQPIHRSFRGITSSNVMKSNCIQRPTSDTHISSSPLYPPVVEHFGNLTSIWNDSHIESSSENQPQLNSQGQNQSSEMLSDFPLYDPFNSGAGLSLLSLKVSDNQFEKYLEELRASQNCHINEMSALDEAIEEFKRSCINNLSIKPCEQL